MIGRLAPGPEQEPPSTPTDITSDEAVDAASGSRRSGELVLTFAGVVVEMAGLAWRIYQGLGDDARAWERVVRDGDAATVKREAARLKAILLERLQREAVTPAALPERGRARILEAAAEEVLAEARR